MGPNWSGPGTTAPSEKSEVYGEGGELRKCRNCQKVNPPDAKYCLECGSRLQKAEIETSGGRSPTKCTYCDKPGRYSCKDCNRVLCENHTFVWRTARRVSTGFDIGGIPIYETVTTRLYSCQDCIYKSRRPWLIAGAIIAAIGVSIRVFFAIFFPNDSTFCMILVPIGGAIALLGFLGQNVWKPVSS